MDLEKLWARRHQRLEWESVEEYSAIAAHTPVVMVAEGRHCSVGGRQHDQSAKRR